MSVYLDASVLVSMLVTDSHSARVEAWLSSGVKVAASPWTLAECSSALSLRQRTGFVDAAGRQAAEAFLDQWSAGAHLEAILAADFEASRQAVRADSVLRAPDALHLAIAQRLGLTLATLDIRLAEAAGRAGVDVAVI